VFAVGARGTILHYGCEKEQWDDVIEEECDWETVMDEDLNELSAVWVDPAGVPYVGGSEGLFRVRSGAPINLWNDGYLTDLWGYGGTLLYGVGDNSTVVRCVDEICEPLGGAAEGDHLGVFGFDDGQLFVVGDRVWHFDGQSWQDLQTGVDARFQDIWGPSPNRLFAVGNLKGEVPRGVVLSFDGVAWTEGAGRDDMRFVGVWGTSAADVYVVGYNEYAEAGGAPGVVLHFDGIAWSEIEIDPGAGYRAIWGTGPQNIYISAAGEPDLQGARTFRVHHFDGTAWTPTEVCSEGPILDLHGTAQTGIFGVENESALYRYPK
jgi:hypothetical protein